MSQVKQNFHPEVGPVIKIGFARQGAAMESGRGGKPEIAYYNALIDTGAYSTAVSKDAAENMGLQFRSYREVISGYGVNRSKVYHADIFIPDIKFWKPGVGIVEFSSRFREFDALLGRDVLSAGVLIMDSIKRETTFRVPRGSPRASPVASSVQAAPEKSTGKRSFFSWFRE